MMKSVSGAGGIQSVSEVLVICERSKHVFGGRNKRLTPAWKAHTRSDKVCLKQLLYRMVFFLLH